MTRFKAVVDTNLVVRAFIFTPDHIKNQIRPALRQLIYAFYGGFFSWIWSDDILAEYDRIIYEKLPNTLPHSFFIDTKGYELLREGICETEPKTTLTVHSMLQARKTLLSLGRHKKHQDPDDAHILATEY